MAPLSKVNKAGFVDALWPCGGRGALPHGEPEFESRESESASD